MAGPQEKRFSWKEEEEEEEEEAAAAVLERVSGMGPLDEAVRTPVSPCSPPPCPPDGCTAPRAERDSALQVTQSSADSGGPQRASALPSPDATTSHRSLFAIDTPDPPDTADGACRADGMALSSGAQWPCAALEAMPVYTWPGALDSLSLFASGSSSDGLLVSAAAAVAPEALARERVSVSDEEDNCSMEAESDDNRTDLGETKSEATEALSVSKLFSFVRKIVDGSGTPRPRKPVQPQGEKLADRNDAELTERELLLYSHSSPLQPLNCTC